MMTIVMYAPLVLLALILGIVIRLRQQRKDRPHPSTPEDFVIVAALQWATATDDIEETVRVLREAVRNYHRSVTNGSDT